MRKGLLYTIKIKPKQRAQYNNVDTHLNHNFRVFSSRMVLELWWETFRKETTVRQSLWIKFNDFLGMFCMKCVSDIVVWKPTSPRSSPPSDSLPSTCSHVHVRVDAPASDHTSSACSDGFQSWFLVHGVPLLILTRPIDIWLSSITETMFFGIKVDFFSQPSPLFQQSFDSFKLSSIWRVCNPSRSTLQFSVIVWLNFHC